MTFQRVFIFCPALISLAFPAYISAGFADSQKNAEPVAQDPLPGVEPGNPGSGSTTPPAPADLAKSPYAPLTGRERRNIYLHDAFASPGAFFRATGPALGAQRNNEPPEWGQGMEGYSKRVANRFGRDTIYKSYEAAGAAVLGHEVRYLPSKRPGFLPRATHALTANFITYDRHGHRTPHVTRVGSAIGAEFTGNLWMPDDRRNASEAMRGAGMQLGVSGAFNLIREFSPELKRFFRWN